MGESACFMHSLSFGSGMTSRPNNHGNLVHALGDSVSFGRFASESLAWEKWSTFPHKRYVEEAESYVQPGSVAQKKAFFEAHYKRSGAQKSAVVLIEQEKAKSQVEERVCGTNHVAQDLEATAFLNPHDSPAMVYTHKLPPAVLNSEMALNEEQQIKNQDVCKEIDVDMHRSAVIVVPLETNKIAISHSTLKSCVTPMITPSKVKNRVNMQLLAAISVKRRMEMTVHPVGSKRPGQKWHFFSAVLKSLRAYRNKLQSLTLSSIFTLRTEERAARREQKFEEKVTEKEAQKVPLSSFYNGIETPESLILKATAKAPTPARKPPPTIFLQPSSTKKASRRLQKTNNQTPTIHPLTSLAKLFAKFKSFLCNFQL